VKVDQYWVRAGVTSLLIFSTSSQANLSQNCRSLLGRLMRIEESIPHRPEAAEILKVDEVAEAARKQLLREAKKNYNNFLKKPLLQNPTTETAHQLVNEGLKSFDELSPGFDRQNFIRWLDEHPADGSKKFKSVGDWLEDRVSSFHDFQKGTSKNKGWFECLSKNKIAQQTLATDYLFFQGSLANMYKDQFRPTLDKMAQNNKDKRTGFDSDPLLPANAKIVERFPFDWSLNSTIWSAIYAEANCKFLFSTGKFGKSFEGGPLTAAEKFEATRDQVLRLSKISLMADASYIVLGSAEDALLGKPFDPVHDYLGKAPMYFIYSTFWSPLRSSLYVEPMKMKIIPALAPKVGEQLQSWAKTESQRRLATMGEKAAEAGMQMGFRVASNSEGIFVFNEIYDKHVVPVITKKVEQAVAQFSGTNSKTPQTYDKDGMMITIKPQSNGELSVEVIPSEEGMKLLTRQFDGGLDQSLALKIRNDNQKSQKE
jgi:hypothetical protein